MIPDKTFPNGLALNFFASDETSTSAENPRMMVVRKVLRLLMMGWPEADWKTLMSLTSSFQAEAPQTMKPSGVNHV